MQPSPARRGGLDDRMQTFSTLILEREMASEDEVERAISHQALHGGHLGTNLMELGIVPEKDLQELLGEIHDLPLGPEGKLPPVRPKLEARLPKEVARRYRVVPLRVTPERLDIATCGPLHPKVASELAAIAGLEIQPLLVTPLRLHEGLHRWCGLPITERERWLLDALASGRSPSRERSVTLRNKAAALFPAAAPYRRMSEHPDGITPSSRQPDPLRVDDLGRRHTSTRPDGLGDSEEPGTLQPGASRPSSIGSDSPSHAPESSMIPSSSPPGSVPSTSQAPPSDYPDDGHNRITRPYTEGDGEEGEVGDEEESKRDTQPWRDDAPDGDGPMSMPSEFRSSLSDTPPSKEAKMQEEHRRFRHRGPFTRAQAELAVSQAPDVHYLLEILLRYARQFFERCIVFVVTDTRADLRLAYGFGMELATLSLPLEHDGLLAEAFTTGDPVVRPLAKDGMDALLRQKLRIESDPRVAAIPLCIRERVVALFYGDDRGEGVDRSAVADVTDFTEICAGEVTRIIIHRKRGE